jgi:hypothetical protein
VWLRVCRVARKSFFAGTVGPVNSGGALKKATNSARNRKTLQEKAQNLNEWLLLPVYFYG